MGEFDTALAMFNNEPAHIFRQLGLTLTYYSLNHSAEFEQAFRKLTTEYGESAPYAVAQVYAWIGDKDAAFEWLMRTRPGEFYIFKLFGDPLLSSLRVDYRWDSLNEKIGISDHQLSRIKFDPVQYLPF